jgi:glycosyltransferase involved in cell wall biosynthesis
MQEIKVSICVPVYGGEKYIAQCARSLFEQSYDNIEYVFVNDCTKDKSIEVVQHVVEDYPHRKKSLRIVNHDRNRGLAASRRTGVENSLGDYFLHIDEDDYLEKDAIRQYVDCAMETDADIVMADHNYVMSNGIVPHYDVVPADKKAYVKMLLTRQASIEIWGRLIRRSFVMEHSLFAPEGLDMSEDFVLIPRMVYLAKRVAKVDACLLNYVRYNEGAGSKGVKLRGLETTAQAMEILEDFFTKIPDSADYAETLTIAKLHNKVTLYGIAAKKDYGFIRPLYPEVSVWRSSLGLKKKILLTLASWGLDSIVFHTIGFFKK